MRGLWREGALCQAEVPSLWDFARGSTPISLQGGADSRRSRRGFRTHLASGTDVPRAYTSTFFRPPTGRSSSLWQFACYLRAAKVPAALGYQLPYPRDLYRNRILDVNAGRSNTYK
jgi:hypothetical protein